MLVWSSCILTREGLLCVGRKNACAIIEIELMNSIEPEITDECVTITRGKDTAMSVRGACLRAEALGVDHAPKGAVGPDLVDADRSMAVV